MRKVLWIVLLAAMAIPMLTESASARHRRGGGCCDQSCYGPPVQIYYYCPPVYYAPPTYYAPSAPGPQQPAQPPVKAPEPPRPTTPPIE